MKVESINGGTARMQVQALTKESGPEVIKKYFEEVRRLSESDNEFPVNLEEVWPLVYSAKEKAVRELTGKFIQGVDYKVLAKNGENPQGGRPTNDYVLSLSCLEFFIARKVRDVFEIYRHVKPYGRQRSFKRKGRPVEDEDDI